MSLVFPQKEPLAGVVARSPVIVQAALLKTSNREQFVHVRVERCFRGGLPAGAELEIHPAGYALGCQVAEALASGGLAPSYALPLMEGNPPELLRELSYVFLLQPGREQIHEMSALQAWRAAAEAGIIQALCGSAS